MKLLLGLCFILFALGEGNALSCLRCARYTGSTPSELIPGYEFEYDGSWHTCSEPDPFTATRDICPEGDDYVCGHMKVRISKTVQKERTSSSRNPDTGHYDRTVIPYNETYTSHFNIKRCMHPRVDSNEFGCTNDYRTIGEELSRRLGLTESDLRGIKIRGNICYCTTSLCDPSCGDHAYIVKEVCIPKWSVAAVLGGLFGILVLSITCCCCCCKCCRTCCCYFCRKRSKPTGQNRNGREQPYTSVTSPTFVRRPVYIYKPLQNENHAEGLSNPVYWSNEQPPSANRGSLQHVA